MTTNRREVIEGIQYQGADESISYTVDVSAVGSSPGSPVVVVKNATAGTVDTATVMPANAPSVTGDVITLSPLRALTAGVLYRVEVKYEIDGNVLESYFYVQAEA